MSTEAPEPDEFEVGESVGIEINIYPEEAAEKAMRQVFLGVQPMVILEVKHDEDTDQVSFVYTGSCIDDVEELLEMLDTFKTFLEGVVEQHGAEALAAMLTGQNEADDEALEEGDERG